MNQSCHSMVSRAELKTNLTDSQCSFSQHQKYSKNLMEQGRIPSFRKGIVASERKREWCHHWYLQSILNSIDLCSETEIHPFFPFPSSLSASMHAWVDIIYLLTSNQIFFFEWIILYIKITFGISMTYLNLEMLPYSPSYIHDSDINKSSVMVVCLSFCSKRSKHEDNRPKFSSLRTEFVSLFLFLLNEWINK